MPDHWPVSHLHEPRLVGRQTAGRALQLERAIVADDLLDGAEAVAAGLRRARAGRRAVGARARAQALAHYAPTWKEDTVTVNKILYI